MRRLLIPTLSAALLLLTISAPARADWKEYRDCLSFTNRWCDLAREDANNWLEEKAVDVVCLGLLTNCITEAF